VSSRITDLLSSNGGNWDTPQIRESKSNAVISRLRSSSISNDVSNIANSTEKSESRYSGRNEYVPSKHSTARCSSPAKVNSTNKNSIQYTTIELSHKAAIPL